MKNGRRENGGKEGLKVEMNEERNKGTKKEGNKQNGNSFCFCFFGGVPTGMPSGASLGSALRKSFGRLLGPYGNGNGNRT